MQNVVTVSLSAPIRMHLYMLVLFMVTASVKASPLPSQELGDFGGDEVGMAPAATLEDYLADDDVIFAEDGGLKSKRAWNSNFSGGLGKRAWNKNFSGGLGKRAWNRNFSGGLGKRGWASNFSGGLGKRSWNSNFSGGLGKRAWNSGFSGGMGKRGMDYYDGQH